MAVLAGIALDVVSKFHEGTHLSAGEIGDRTKILAGHSRGRGKDIGVLLHGNRGFFTVEIFTFKGRSASHDGDLSSAHCAP